MRNLGVRALRRRVRQDEVRVCISVLRWSGKEWLSDSIALVDSTSLGGERMFLDGALRGRTISGELMLGQPRQWSRGTSFDSRMASLAHGDWDS